MSSLAYTYSGSYAGQTRGSPKLSKPSPPNSSPENLAARLDKKKMKPPNPTMPQARKRKVIDLTRDEYHEEDEVAAAAAQAALAGIANSKPKKARTKKKDEPGEKRLKRFREKPPVSYLERLERVSTQRMFLIDRRRTTSEDGGQEEEVFDIVGSTGNVYQVSVKKVPTCSCPDGRKGNQCKHIVYVLVNVLKAREHLAYQLAFLSTELREVFANAPVTPQSSNATAQNADTVGHRKPIEGDCPVCVMEFDQADDPEDIVWCKAACGQNIHRGCMEQWSKSKPGPVKCVYCRTIWKDDEDMLMRISKSGVVNSEGYVNVAGELGISSQRDYSSYHAPWVQRQFGGQYRNYY